MDETEGIEMIECPDCKARIFTKNVCRHYWTVHNIELSSDGKIMVLEEAKQNPLSKKQIFDQLKRLESAPLRERTPSSIRKYKGGSLGPEKR